MTALLRSLVLAILVLAGVPAKAGSFTGEQLLTTNASLVAQFPEVAYYGNNIHIVFVGFIGGLQGDIYYMRSGDNGVSFTNPVNLSANATGSTGNDRPQVAAGPMGVYVAWNSNNDNGAIYFQRSGDNGVSFTPTALLAGVEGGFYSRLTDIFTDGSGRTHLVYYDAGYTPGVGMIRHRMTCDGINWGADTGVTSTNIDGDVDNEQPRIGEAGGKLYVTFRSTRQGIPQGGWAPSSVHLQEGTVSCPAAVATWRFPARRVAGGFPLTFGTTYRPEVVGDASGMLHLTWWETTQGSQVMYKRGLFNSSVGPAMNLSNLSIDHREPGGLTSSAAQPLGGYQVPPAFASNGTNSFLAYENRTTTNAGNYEFGPIFLRESGNVGATWGAAVQVGTGSMPRLAIGGPSSGNVAIVWTDPSGGFGRIKFRLYTLGGGSSPSYNLSPSAHNWGNLQASTSVDQAFTLVNIGAAGTVGSASIGGTDPTSADFTIVGNTCGGALAGGGSCTVTVRLTPTAFGARAATLSVATDAGTQQATLSGTGVKNIGSFDANVRAVVTGYYETIFGRAPDTGAAAYWAGEASRVVGLGADVREVFYALSVQFFNHAEYQARGRTDSQFMTDLYRTFFLRDPDPSGQTFWQGYLNQGMDRSSLLINFLFSPEFAAYMEDKFGSQTIRPEINMTVDLYRGILGRLPDSGGFNYWLGRMRTAQCQGQAAVTAEVNNLAILFIGSPEYGAIQSTRPFSLQTEMHVGDLYNAFLRRGPEPSGFGYWVNQIDTGQRTRDNVRQFFVDSPEFQARVTAVINAGCLP